MKKTVFFTLVVLTLLLSSCFKKAPEQPASNEQPTSKFPAPFSRGPTGPPRVSAPTYPIPGQ